MRRTFHKVKDAHKGKNKNNEIEPIYTKANGYRGELGDLD